MAITINGDKNTKSGLENLDKQIYNHAREVSIQEMYENFKEEYPDLTSEQYESAHLQIKEAMSNFPNVTKFQIEF